jgi:hypothetical protein
VVPDAISSGIAASLVFGTIGSMTILFMFVRGRLKASQQSHTDPVEISELRETVRRLDGEIADLTERVDFAERLLAKQREAERVKGGQ